MKLRYSAVLALTLLAGPAHAQGGINLSWEDCGTSGQALATFACNANTTVQRLYVSFVSPQPLTQLVGVEIVIDAAFNQSSVPPWWLVQPAGGCRPGALTSSANFVTGPTACADPWSGSAVSMVDATPGVPFAHRMRIGVVAAVPSSSPVSVDDQSEYYAAALILNHSRTVGAGSCAGCAIAGCIALTTVRLIQPVGVGDHVISWPLSNTIVGWQCPAFMATPAPVCFACPVPSKSRSWGTIKGMFR